MEIKYRNLLGAILLFLFLGNITFVQAQTVLETLKNNRQTSQFAAAIERAGLNDRFNQKNASFTVFAPSNSAFNRLSASEKNSSQVLLNHVITGTATKRSLQYMSNITCLSGLTVEVAQMDDNSLEIQDYSIIQSNIRADNGVIHVIDGVIQ